MTNIDEKTMDSTRKYASLLMTILDDSNQLVQVSDFETLEMLYANRTARFYSGKEDLPYQGRHCYKYMMGQEEQCPFCPLKKLNGRDVAELEIDNGEQVFSVKTIVQDWDGRKVFIEYARDITEIRNSERIFKEQMERLLKSIPHAQGIMHFDVTDDVTLTTGGISRNMEGFKRNVTVNETIAKMATFTPSAEERKKFYKDFCRDAILKAYEEGKVEFSKITKSYFDDGSIRYARIVARLLKNPTTNHLECVVYGMDISKEMKEREENENNLREQLAIFDALSKNYLNVYLADVKHNKIKILKMDGYVTTGLDKNISKKVPDKVYDYDVISAQYVRERVYEEDKEYMTKIFEPETIEKELSDKDSYSGTYRALVNGEPHDYQFLFYKLKDSDEIIAAFQNIDSITQKEKERQQILATALEAAEQSNLAKTQFLNNMSHDIRTPMNAIIGFTNLAEQNVEDTEKVTDYLEKIDTSSQHLLSLINDVLDMSRIESGRVKLEEGEVHLPEITKELQAILSPDIEKKNIHLITDTKTVINKSVICDKLRLKQILINLLSNAIKFTNPGGTVKVTVKQKPSSLREHATYEIRVKDNGIGMSKEFQKHVFEAFSRERTSTVSGMQGTGLGMAITKNIVDLMGGTIHVKSEEGVGTEFVVKLQLKVCGDTTSKFEDKKDTTPIDFTGKKILLVEDNQLNQEIAKEILQQVGFEVDTANDGEEAVQKVKEGNYDVVLMDIQMPKMDGYTAARIIRNLPNKDIANIPILAVTANAFEEDKNAAVSVGMNGHVAKPLDVEQLLSKLSEVLR